MQKPRKNVSLDTKTHERLRKLAFKKKTTIANLIRSFTENPVYVVSDNRKIELSETASGSILPV